LRRIISQSFPSEASLACLGGSGVELIVCQRTQALPAPLPRGPFGPFRLEHVYADPVGVDVYRLRRAGTRVSKPAEAD
jgi:hypothetical protein